MEVISQHRRVGLGRRETSRNMLRFLLLVSFLMVLFSLYGARASVFEKARESLLDVAEPILTIFSAPVKWVDDRIGAVEDYFNVLEQNKLLRIENAELRVWMHEAISLRREVQYFEKLYEMRVPEDTAMIDARVIGEVNGPYAHAQIVNAGSRDGVTRGSAVVDVNGLVGRVVTTGRSASRVLLVTDYNAMIPVLVEGAEIEAIMAGQALALPVLKYIDSLEPGRIQPGMRVITSGAGGGMARGLPVGVVENVSADKISVRPFSQRHNTHAVRVVQFTSSDLDTTKTDHGIRKPASSDLKGEGRARQRGRQ